MGISYKGAISFGLVYIPITLHNVIKSNDISFNLIDKKTMSRIKYKKTCIDCNNEEVKTEDIVKGYEYEEGKYVVFDANDFEKIKTQKDKNITIEQFVNLSSIDPIYYDKAYFVVPSTGAIKPFTLLKEAMTKEHKVGIAKTVLGTKETLIAIRVKDDKMLLNTMFFNDEIKPNPFDQEDALVNQQELDLAITLINSMTKPFAPETYVNEYRKKIEKAIEDKINGKEIILKEETGHQLLDLMSALEQSLKNVQESG